MYTCSCDTQNPKFFWLSGSITFLVRVALAKLEAEQSPDDSKQASLDTISQKHRFELEQHSIAELKKRAQMHQRKQMRRHAHVGKAPSQVPGEFAFVICPDLHHNVASRAVLFDLLADVGRFIYALCQCFLPPSHIYWAGGGHQNRKVHPPTTVCHAPCHFCQTPYKTLFMAKKKVSRTTPSSCTFLKCDNPSFNSMLRQHSRLLNDVNQ